MQKIFVDGIQILVTTWASYDYATRYEVTRYYETTVVHHHFTGNEIEFELNSWELAIEYFSSREKSRFYHHLLEHLSLSQTKMAVFYKWL